MTVKPRVAIVVPLPLRSSLSADEAISLRHLRHYLGHYDRYVVAARSGPISDAVADFAVVRFDDGYFGTLRAYASLMLSPEFYEAFAGEYDWILLYHLDALALSDQLSYWCGQEWDFIGAPVHHGAPTFSVPCQGGFSLRRIRTFLELLRSREYGVDPDTYWERLRAGLPPLLRPLYGPVRYLKRLRRYNNISREIRLLLADRDEPHEDMFIVRVATKYYPPFRIPTVAEALRFAWDQAPRKAFEMNGRQLPFGAHAWYKVDRAFWEPYLLTSDAAAALSGEARTDATWTAAPAAERDAGRADPVNVT